VSESSAINKALIESFLYLMVSPFIAALWIRRGPGAQPPQTAAGFDNPAGA
jgi:hypothetical protein